jgi:hypothetical protein
VLAAFAAGCGGPPAPPQNIPSPSDQSEKETPKDPVVSTSEKPADKPAPPNPSVAPTKEGGVVRGEVRCGDAPAADAVAWLTPAPASLSNPAGDPVTLALRWAAFRPHVAVARQGAVVQLSARDGSADFVTSGAASFSASLRQGETATFPLRNAGLVEVRSELHADWAPAYVHVVDRGIAVVTGSDGVFRLPDLPSGDYELALWHESWVGSDGPTPPEKRWTRVKLTVKAGEGAEVRWTLPAAPKTP